MMMMMMMMMVMMMLMVIIIIISIIKVKNESYLIRQDNTVYKISIKLSFSSIVFVICFCSFELSFSILK